MGLGGDQNQSAYLNCQFRMDFNGTTRSLQSALLRTDVAFGETFRFSSVCESKSLVSGDDAVFDFFVLLLVLIVDADDLTLSFDFLNLNETKFNKSIS